MCVVDLKKYEIANEGVLLASTAAVLGLGIIAAVAQTKIEKMKLKSRIKNMTEEEKLSRENFLNSWVPELAKFHDIIESDINKNAQLSKMFDVIALSKTFNIEGGYNIHLVNLNYEQNKKSTIDETTKSISPMDKYIAKWKNYAKKFMPYFEFMAEYDNDIDPEESPLLDIILICKWVDKDGMLKPGLPKFK